MEEEELGHGNTHIYREFGFCAFQKQSECPPKTSTMVSCKPSPGSCQQISLTLLAGMPHVKEILHASNVHHVPFFSPSMFTWPGSSATSKMHRVHGVMLAAVTTKKYCYTSYDYCYITIILTITRSTPLFAIRQSNTSISYQEQGNEPHPKVLIITYKNPKP